MCKIKQRASINTYQCGIVKCELQQNVRMTERQQERGRKRTRKWYLWVYVDRKCDCDVFRWSVKVKRFMLYGCIFFSTLTVFNIFHVRCSMFNVHIRYLHRNPKWKITSRFGFQLNKRGNLWSFVIRMYKWIESHFIFSVPI